MKNIKTAILSIYPLPYHKIGSWTTMYNYYLQSYDHKIDYIIAPKCHICIDSVIYENVKEVKYAKDKLSRFIKYYKYRPYWKSLYKVIKKESFLIIQIIDNKTLLLAIDYFAKKYNMRDKIKILFFMHGYSYSIAEKELNQFYQAMDDLILLTKDSYHYQMSKVHAIPSEVTHIYNGVDSDRFYPLELTQKIDFRYKLGLDNDKLYFIWVSQDRPKKGLHIILKAWEKLTERYPDIELLIIGTKNEIKGKQIKWLGRIPNEQLAPYYQVSDFYLFSTLCHEGQPMSLTEAIKCGCTCIASNIAPISEVMSDGNYGRLVNFPHSPEQWVLSISEEIDKYQKNNNSNIYQKNIPDKIYDLDIWCNNMNQLITKWKNR